MLERAQRRYIHKRPRAATKRWKAACEYDIHIRYLSVEIRSTDTFSRDTSFRIKVIPWFCTDAHFSAHYLI